MAALRADFTREAEQEAHEAFRWYWERDPAVGDRFEELFVQAIVGISEAPVLDHEIEPGVRRRLLPPFPYAIVYEVEPRRRRTVR